MLPLTVIVPMELPGANTPPLAVLTAPLMVPVPPSMPPELIVTGEAIEPFTASVPALTAVAPE